MSGHSHWATIKHKKAATDAKKNKVFSKMARAIIVAAKQGGSDPDSNSKLQYAIEAARAVNMPRENIERAIKRGAGEVEGITFKELTYEGYGPGGVAIIVDCLTDNLNRTASEIRKVFEQSGGKLGNPNSVTYMFERKGVIHIPVSSTTEDDLMAAALDAGADNLAKGGDFFEVTTAPSDFDRVKKALSGKFKIETSELTMLPKNLHKIDEETGRKVLNLMDAIDDCDDVQKIYADFDLPETMIAK